MSIFLKNICPYSDCQNLFHTLTDLIVHIEREHLDFDPLKIEQLENEKPDNLPMSYVLKFSTAEDAPPRQYCTPEDGPGSNKTVIIKTEPSNEIVSATAQNYAVFEKKEKKTAKPHKNDWKLNEDFAQILSEHHKLFTVDYSLKKPFICSMPACEKRYKNVNGIKYHYKKHHKLHTPTLRKTVTKYRSLINLPTKLKKELHGIPLTSYRTDVCPSTAVVYQNIPETSQFDNGDYFYRNNSFPTSSAELFHVTNQVPLCNMSFNNINNNYYYNVTDLGDMEDFSSARNSQNYHFVM